MQFFLLWLKRFFLSRHHFVRWTPLVSIFSLILAVSTLTLALSVYSGYENTVRQAVLDMTGHLMITARDPVSEKTLLQKIKNTCPTQKQKESQNNRLQNNRLQNNRLQNNKSQHNRSQTTTKQSDTTSFSGCPSMNPTEIITLSPFVSLPILVLRDGKLSGALLEGHPPSRPRKGGTRLDGGTRPDGGTRLDGETRLDIKHRIKAGVFNLQDKKSAMIGQSLAQKLKLKPGDIFHAVAPKMDSQGFFRKTYQELKVKGILDMGFHDFNARYIITHIQTAQNLNQSNFISGVRLLLKNPKKAKKIRSQLKKALGPSYKVEDWEDIVKSQHANYFQAVQKEKILIFFILMVLVLAGAFNVSSHLTISILNQAHSLSILKAMGAQDIFIFSLLLTQGFIISFIGTIGGIAVGWGLSFCFVAVQNIWPLIPSDIYKVSYITTTLKINDILMIILCSQVICLVSCLLPALRALKMTIRENLIAD